MATKQDNPMNRNPEGKGGFQERPQDRNNGAWKKTDTARYKLEQIMNFTDKQHLELQDNPEAPTFEKRVSVAVQLGQWKEIEGMINQVYGKPKEFVETIIKEAPKPLEDLTEGK